MPRHATDRRRPGASVPIQRTNLLPCNPRVEDRGNSVPAASQGRRCKNLLDLVAELAGEIGTIERFSKEGSLALYIGMSTLDNSSGKYQGSKQPKHVNYWIADSDAVNSIDSYEAMLWFLSRGDECLNVVYSISADRSLFAFINRRDRGNSNSRPYERSVKFIRAGSV